MLAFTPLKINAGMWKNSNILLKKFKNEYYEMDEMQISRESHSKSMQACAKIQNEMQISWKIGQGSVRVRAYVLCKKLYGM